jgi:hypothetical protein
MRGTARRLITALCILTPLSGASSALRAQADEPVMAHAHMSLTPTRPGTAADTARATRVVHELQTAIAPYETLDAANAAGFRALRDSGTVKDGKLLHVGKRMRRAGGQAAFDPKTPQALLYRRAPDGGMRLAGAMYVAPLSATPEDLDAMIPLSVAHWHRHVNVCASADRKSFKPFPKVTTPEGCEAVGGRFRAESRYMIHVMIDAGDDPAKAFPQGQEMAAMDMGPGHAH